MRVLTSDVFCGAFLLANGASVVEVLVDRSGVRQSGTFVFEGHDLLHLQELYSRGEACANVKAIRDGVTSLRNRLSRVLKRAA